MHAYPSTTDASSSVELILLLEMRINNNGS